MSFSFQHSIASYAQVDDKNIRRRIYDALNVLMALDIISKEGKEIRWNGMDFSPENEFSHLHATKTAIERRIFEKKKKLRELLLQYIAARHLQERNQKAAVRPDGRVYVPFVTISCKPTTNITCEVRILCCTAISSLIACMLVCYCISRIICYVLSISDSLTFCFFLFLFSTAL
jgi:Transcription factor DP/E2F/DP family winged-helix DNA-binding domain